MVGLCSNSCYVSSPARLCSSWTRNISNLFNLHQKKKMNQTKLNVRVTSDDWVVDVRGSISIESHFATQNTNELKVEGVGGSNTKQCQQRGVINSSRSFLGSDRRKKKTNDSEIFQHPQFCSHLNCYRKWFPYRQSLPASKYRILNLDLLQWFFLLRASNFCLRENEADLLLFHELHASKEHFNTSMLTHIFLGLNYGL